MRGIHMTLEMLPEGMREQARRKIAADDGRRNDATTTANNSNPSPNVRQKPRKPHKPNATEAQFNAEYLFGKGQFEAVTFHLPGGSRYTPDFVEFVDGRIICYEVKGEYRLPSEGRAITAFRECRAAFPAVTFLWFAKQGRFFIEKHKVDE